VFCLVYPTGFFDACIPLLLLKRLQGDRRWLVKFEQVLNWNLVLQSEIFPPWIDCWFISSSILKKNSGMYKYDFDMQSELFGCERSLVILSSFQNYQHSVVYACWNVSSYIVCSWSAIWFAFIWVWVLCNATRNQYGYTILKFKKQLVNTVELGFTKGYWLWGNTEYNHGTHGITWYF